MKKDKLTDEMIARAASEYVEAWLASIPEPEELPFEPSPKYKANMAKLLKKMERREKMHRFTRCAAAFFLVLFLGSAAFVGLMPEARAGFTNWVRTAYDDTFTVNFRGDEVPEKMPVCELTWVPAGCELIKKTEAYNYFSLVYEDANEQGFIFSYSLMTGNSSMFIGVDERAESERIYLDDREAEIFYSEDGDIMVLWTDEDGFAYSVMGNLEKSVIERIAEGVKITK